MESICLKRNKNIPEKYGKSSKLDLDLKTSLF